MLGLMLEVPRIPVVVQHYLVLGGVFGIQCVGFEVERLTVACVYTLECVSTQVAVCF